LSLRRREIIKESFYKGEEKTESETIEVLKKMAREDATFNIIGKRSVKAALQAGIIGEDAIGKIQDVEFALVLL